MMIARTLIILFAIAIALSLIAYILTNQRKYLHWGLKLFKSLLVIGLLFFVVLLLQRIV